MKNLPKLITINKIWDYADHNAFTDLIHYQDMWLCVFRESSSHMKGLGFIRLLSSDDGKSWQSLHVFSEDGIDLRDPKLSITPCDKLMLLCGGTQNYEDIYVNMQSRVSFSKDLKTWTPFQSIIERHEWLWKVTWHKNKVYGVSYRFSDVDDKKKEWLVKLWESDDGVNYKLITNWQIDNHPNETALQFIDDDKMVALVRRDGPIDRKAWIGVSAYPYKEWDFSVTHGYFGGPNLIRLPCKDLLAAGRVMMINPYGYYAHTVLAKFNLKDFKPIYILPSFDDSSYPGLFFKDGVLWMSYYSSHEGKSAIYIAQFEIN